ncbi:MAG: hypothetical protein R3F34_09525 [Planctomycetota bacterium]
MGAVDELEEEPRWAAGDPRRPRRGSCGRLWVGAVAETAPHLPEDPDFDADDADTREFHGVIVQHVTWTEHRCQCGFEFGEYLLVDCETIVDDDWELFEVTSTPTRPPDRFATGVIDIQESPMGYIVISGEAKFVHHSDLEDDNNTRDKEWNRTPGPDGEITVEVNVKETSTGLAPSGKELPEGVSWDDDFGDKGQDLDTKSLLYVSNDCQGAALQFTDVLPAHQDRRA